MTMLLRKLRLAPPGEVTMKGKDVSTWTTTGLEARADIGDKFKVTLDADGFADWEPIPPSDRQAGSIFIRGSHTDWEPEELEEHPLTEGLWTAVISLGDSGEECFQVLEDGSDELV